MELADVLEMSLTLSQASPSSSSTLMPDPEACSTVYSDLAESMLLAWSSSEEVDVLGVEADVLSESASSLTLTYEVLVDVITCAKSKLKLDWSLERK